MNKNLSSLATLRVGVTIRNRITDNPTGQHHLIQFRDVDKEAATITGATRIDGQAFHKGHLLEVGDILFTAKGSPNKAILYTRHHQQQYPNTLALSIFTIIRVHSPRILPAYLAWYINSPAGQKALEKMKEGSVIVSINNKTLQQLSIPLPPLEKQQIIIQLIQYLEQEKALHLKLIQEKNRLVHRIITEAIE